MRYLIKFSYDGTKFHGFQRQKDVKNVQGTLEKNISKVIGEEILIKGSGRTDAGVHAKCQAAHFDAIKKVTKKEVLEINKMLGGEIIIKSIKEVNGNFHARHSVKKKCYVYKINNGAFKKEYDGYYYQLRYPLDIKKMKKVSKLFLGTHDFQNFVSGYRDSYLSTIYKIKIKKRNDIIEITFWGVGFFRYMVRHLVGALIDVGRGKVNDEVIIQMLENPGNCKKLSVVPASGLYLKKIVY